MVVPHRSTARAPAGDGRVGVLVASTGSAQASLRSAEEVHVRMAIAIAALMIPGLALAAGARRTVTAYSRVRPDPPARHPDATEASAVAHKIAREWEAA